MSDGVDEKKKPINGRAFCRLFCSPGRGRLLMDIACKSRGLLVAGANRKEVGRRNFLKVSDTSQKKRVCVLLLLHCVFGTDSAGISVANDLVAWCQHATVGQTRLVFNTNSSSSFMCAAAAVLLLLMPSRVISAQCWLSVECSLRRMCSVFLFRLLPPMISFLTVFMHSRNE